MECQTRYFIRRTVAESIEWSVRKKKVWNPQDKKKTDIHFLHLNLINEYNQHMNSADIADQLRGIYPPNHWMRFRKWWWSYFI